MFKVTIERVEQVERNVNQWLKVADTGNDRDGGAVYDHVPTATTQTERTDILVMTLDTLNLPAVVDALLDRTPTA